MKKCCWLYARERLSTYGACFIGKTMDELVDDFNHEVNEQQVDQDRIYYREALIQAIEEKGVDVSAVMVDDEISFALPIVYDGRQRALVVNVRD